MKRNLKEDTSRQTLFLIVHNVRSAHNVGSLFRTADGAGVDKIYLTGYTPRPAKSGKLVLSAAEKELQKTALGAEITVPWVYERSFSRLMQTLRSQSVELIALEQFSTSVDYRKFELPKSKRKKQTLRSMGLIVGNEVTGLLPRELKRVNSIIHLPMRGMKESLNVSVAGAIALYHLRATIEGYYAK